MKFTIFILILLKTVSSQITDTDVEENSSGWYQIEGKVYPPEIGTDEIWQEDTQIIINGGTMNLRFDQSPDQFFEDITPVLIIVQTWFSGEMKGFLRNDGTFIISKVPSGSYVIDIINPNYLYEPVRVEINNKGKFRARKVNVSFKAVLVLSASVSCVISECSTIASSSSSISTEAEGSDYIPLFPAARTMEDHRFPVLADGAHDDSAADSSRSFTKDYERSWNQKRNGESSVAQARRRHARHERDDQQIPRWWILTTKAFDQLD